MKSLIFILFSFIFILSANAGNVLDDIKIDSNAKTSKLEIRFNSNYKKQLKANVVILNAAGKEVGVFKCDINKGSNVVCMHNALNLEEGIYTVALTVKKNTSSTKFVLFK